MKTKVTGLIQRLRGLSVFKRGLLLVFAAGLCLVLFGRVNRPSSKPPAATQQIENSTNEYQFEPDSLAEGEGTRELKPVPAPSRG